MTMRKKKRTEGQGLIGSYRTAGTTMKMEIIGTPTGEILLFDHY